MSPSLSQQRRAGVEAVLTRIAEDPTLRQQLQADPGQALAPISGLGAALEPAEVVGYGRCQSYKWTCRVTFIPK